MNKFIAKAVTIIALSLAIAATLHAGVYTPDNLPLPISSHKVNYITNPDNILSSTAMDSINSTLSALEQEKGVKSLVIVIESIEGDDPYEFAMEIGNKYGVGNKQNTGLIIVLATVDRSYYILTGEGLEKFLPDALCKRIENRVMVPQLKKSNWDTAILHTARAIYDTLNGESELQREENKEYGNKGVIAIILITVSLLLILIIFVCFEKWKDKECPHCKQRKLQLTNREFKTNKIGTRKLIIKRYKCSSCGKEVTRRYYIYLTGNNNTGPFAGGGFSGRIGGGFSGGSFRGGSFGGGSFGGGGAGGRF